MLIESIEPRARELVENFDTEIIVGWVFFIAGGILTFLSLNSAMLPSFVICGIVLVIGGILRLYTSYSKKNTYQTILKNMEDEKEEQNKLYQ